MSAKLLYYSLFGYILLSVILLIVFAFGTYHQAWVIFYYSYLVFALGHIWYVMTLLAKEEFFPRKYPRYNNEKFAVVMPCYNEQPKLFIRAINSVLAADGNKVVYVVDDGSTNGISDVLQSYADQKLITLHTFEMNRGKRYGLYHAITALPDDIEYVITTDSDTLFNKEAFTRVIEALKKPTIGAASGDVQLLNEHTNLLTKMTGAYYWSALRMQRKAQSAMGMVACCSGALAAYKVQVIRPLMDAFLSETFLGERCSYGEDRHLTNLVLKEGHDVVFVPESVAYTETPETYKQFLKQQMRWRRGFVQEAVFSLSFLYKVKPLLFFEVLVFELIVPYMSFGLMLLVIFNLLVDPMYSILVIVPSLIILSIVRHMPMVFYAPTKMPYLILYTFFSFFVSYWQGIYALFTVRNSTWGTR